MKKIGCQSFYLLLTQIKKQNKYLLKNNIYIKMASLRNI